MSAVAAAVARAASHPNASALRHHEFGIWKPTTWAQLVDGAAKLGSGLSAVGIGAGDPVGLLMANHPEWVAADLALQGLGAIVVPIDPSAEADKVVATLEAAQAVAVLCGDQEQFDKVDEMQALGRAGRVRLIAINDTRGVRSLDNLARDNVDRVLTFSQIRDRASGSGWTQSVSALTDSTPAVWTPSGTLSHADLQANADTVAKSLALTSRDRLLAQASFADPLERALSLSAMTLIGSELAIGEGGPLAQQELAAVQPSVLHAAPGYLDKTAAVLNGRISKAKGIRRWALGTGWRPKAPASSIAKPLGLSPLRLIMLGAFLLSVLWIFLSIDMHDVVRLLVVLAIFVLAFVASVLTGSAVVTPLRRQFGLSRARAVVGRTNDDGSSMLGALGVPLLHPDTLLQSNSRGASS
jgi:long-chain acyl-CoA synthetase